MLFSTQGDAERLQPLLQGTAERHRRVAASSSLPQGHPFTRPRAYTRSASFFPTVVFFPAIPTFAERNSPYAETPRYEISLMLTRGIDTVTIKIFWGNFGVQIFNTIHDFHAHVTMKTWCKKIKSKSLMFYRKCHLTRNGCGLRKSRQGNWLPDGSSAIFYLIRN